MNLIFTISLIATLAATSTACSSSADDSYQLQSNGHDETHQLIQHSSIGTYKVNSDGVAVSVGDSCDIVDVKTASQSCHNCLAKVELQIACDSEPEASRLVNVSRDQFPSQEFIITNPLRSER